MKSLIFSIDRQQCSEWCWAAVSAAICRCYGVPDAPDQQRIANMVLGLPQDNLCDCESDPFAGCNEQQNLAVVLDTVDHGRDGINGLSTMRFEDVRAEIDAGRPIAVSVTLDDPAASGHAVAIYGYTDDGIVSIADPMHPNDLISVRFADFVQGAQTSLHGTWQAAYRTTK